jgi:membrane-associated phospholipid phosphatase
MVKRLFVAIALLCAAIPASATQPDNQAIQWNQALLEILRTPGAQPSTVHPTRSLAMMHAAIYDAVNAIDRTHQPYLPHVARAPQDASQEAAAAAAAHRVLVELYPQLTDSLDARLEQALAQVPEGSPKRLGIHIGLTTAESILAQRSNDGSNAPPTPYVPGTQPGDYQLTPPNFPPPVFTHWSAVTPFTLARADQFRPGPPPELVSERYLAAFREVKELGAIDSAARSAEQTEIGLFWSAPIQNYWNEIAQSTAAAQQLNLAQSARLFALLNLTLADSVIAFYDAKYAYRFWRPVSAIRAVDDGNPETQPDPSWTPLTTTTPADPSYPGAHSVISAAGAAVLSAFLGSNEFSFTVHSEVLPQVERAFTSFQAAAREAGLSRIYAGNHFRFDHSAGRRLGRDIARYVLHGFLLPRDPKRASDDR